MSTITQPARSVLKCALMMVFASSLVAHAAAPVVPPKPVPVVKPKPYQTAAQTDVTVAYAFRTRITGAPACQRFATESDSTFLSEKMDSETKVTLLNKIGAEAAASGCLAP